MSFMPSTCMFLLIKELKLKQDNILTLDATSSPFISDAGFILFAINPSFIDLIIGTPPHTEASNSKLTLFFSAILDNLSPYFEIKALFAVTTCFFLFRAPKTNFLAAPSAPPINSITISTLSFFRISM